MDAMQFYFDFQDSNKKFARYSWTCLGLRFQGFSMSLKTTDWTRFFAIEICIKSVCDLDFHAGNPTWLASRDLVGLYGTYVLILFKIATCTALSWTTHECNVIFCPSRQSAGFGTRYHLVNRYFVIQKWKSKARSISIVTLYKINTADSRYLEVQGTRWNTSRYPYLDISDLRNRGKNKSNNHISQINV